MEKTKLWLGTIDGIVESELPLSRSSTWDIPSQE
jgi:hypothetical protein